MLEYLSYSLCRATSNWEQQLSVAIAATSLGLASLVSDGHASGHFISGLQGKYPAYDLNDTYVFRSSNEGHTTFISSANPSKPGTTAPASGVTFGEGGLYNLHIAKNDGFKTGMTLVFSFKGGAVQISQIDAPNAPVGEAGKVLGNGKVGEAIVLSNGVRVWAGRGRDPFFGNGIDLGKFNAAKRAGKFEPKLFKTSGDLFAASAASFIVVDVPNTMLGSEIKVFTTTAVKHKGDWVQAARHANVLFPYVFLNDTPAVQEDHEQHRPDSDVKERRQAVVNNAFWAASVSQAKKCDTMAYANKVADAVMPDVLTYKPGTKARYTIGSLNGRPLHDDAMNTVLQLMYGVAIDDSANDMKRYKTAFPYIVSAK